MTTELARGAAAAVNEVFNINEHRYSIYVEDVAQGLEEPCFLITALETTSTAYSQGRIGFTYPFDIKYFPKIESSRSEMDAVADKLIGAMYMFPLDDDSLVHGTDMHYRLEDGVLHFFVSFKCVLHRKSGEDRTMMEELEQHGGVLNGS